MRAKTLLICSYLLLPLLVWSQTKSLSGLIVDEKDTPLPMVQILVKGTSNGAISGFDGSYVIDVNVGDTIRYTYLGYDDQVIVYGGQKVQNVKMKTASSLIEELVVVGYGAQTREKLVGAINNVSGTELRKTGITNVSHMIQDAMPGVMADISSGQPGADDAKLTIRGASTWNGSNEPYILIDGVQATGGFSQIDASEIASISVLKDAASTAIYGVKGANGVILITTRRGETGRPSVSASFNLTAKMVSDIPDKLNSYEVLMLGQQTYKNGNHYSSLRSQEYINTFLDPNRNIYAYPDVDWYDEMIKPIGWENSARVNISGGTDFVKYFASVSNTHLGDVIKNDAADGYYDPSFSYNKINFRSNLDFNLTRSTKLSVDIAGRSEYRKQPNAEVKATEYSNVFKFIDEATPYLFPTYYPASFVEDSAYNDPLEPDATGVRYTSASKKKPYQANPYNSINKSGMRKYKKDVVDITLGLSQDLNHIVKGLSISGKFSYSNYTQYKKTESLTVKEHIYEAQYGKWLSEGLNYNTEPFDFHSREGESYDGTRRNIYYEGRLDYNRTFGDHTVSAVGVFNRSELLKSISGNKRLKEDWVGRVSYDYKSRYFFEASGGYNGTDLFAPGLRFGFFPSGAVAWNMANEPFFKEVLGLKAQLLKIRYSIGKTGSDPGSDYMYLGGWTSMNEKYSYLGFGDPMASALPRYAESKLANPEATWEDSYKHNLGLDLVMLNNDLDIAIDLFKERRENIFVSEPMPSFFHPKFGKGIKAGNIAPPKVNEGITKNHGVEMEASYGYTFDNDLRLKVGANFTAVENRVIYKADPENRAEYQKEAGKPLGWQKGYQTNGYIDDFEEAINSPNINGGNQPGNFAFADFTGNGEIDSKDIVPLNGVSQPLFIYGFRFGASYKGFDLNVKFYGKEQVYYNASNMYPKFQEYLLSAQRYSLDTWSPSNPNAAYPTYRVAGTSMYKAKNNFNLVDASYLKLQSVTLSYLMKSQTLNRLLHINNVTFSLSGHNLYTWDKLPFGDPEGGNSITGSYGGNYPLVRRITFDMKLNF